MFFRTSLIFDDTTTTTPINLNIHLACSRQTATPATATNSAKFNLNAPQVLAEHSKFYCIFKMESVFVLLRFRNLFSSQISIDYLRNSTTTLCKQINCLRCLESINVAPFVHPPFTRCPWVANPVSF